MKTTDMILDSFNEFPYRSREGIISEFNDPDALCELITSKKIKRSKRVNQLGRKLYYKADWKKSLHEAFANRKIY